MLLVHDVTNNSYDIINLTKEEIIELSNSFDYFPLPQKRIFYRLKKDIDALVSSISQPKKK